jgi:hypothetical protein
MPILAFSFTVHRQKSAPIKIQGKWEDKNEPLVIGGLMLPLAAFRTVS